MANPPVERRADHINLEQRIEARLAQTDQRLGEFAKMVSDFAGQVERVLAIQNNNANQLRLLGEAFTKNAEAQTQLTTELADVLHIWKAGKGAVWWLNLVGKLVIRVGAVVAGIIVIYKFIRVN